MESVGAPQVHAGWFQFFPNFRYLFGSPDGSRSHLIRLAKRSYGIELDSQMRKQETHTIDEK